MNLHNPLIIAQRRKSYIRCSFLAWGLPVIVVGTCLTLQLTKTGNVGYGELIFFLMFFTLNSQEISVSIKGIGKAFVTKGIFT